MGTLNAPEMRGFLEAAGILQVTEVRSLKTEEVGQLLKLKGVRCIITQCFGGTPEWVATAEQDSRWEQQIKPSLASPTIPDSSGYYQAWEWRTDQDEPIIEFMQCYVPI